MTIDTAIRMDSEDTPTPYLSIQASDGTSRYALQQYLIDFKRIRILEQDYELIGQDTYRVELRYQPPEVQKERDTLDHNLQHYIEAYAVLEKEYGKLQKKLTHARDERDRYLNQLGTTEESCDELAKERDRLQKELNRMVNMVDRRTSEMNEVCRARDDLEEERQHLLGECNQLTAERDQIARECNRLNDERNKLAGERDRLVIIAGQRRKKMKQLRQRIDELLETNMELKQERDQANDQFCHVLGGCNQLTALQRKLNDARDNVV